MIDTRIVIEAIKSMAEDKENMKFIRKHLCWILGHKYHAIWFLPTFPHIPGMEDAHCGVADTEAGCVYCEKEKPNEHMMNVAEIDWRKTTHRRTPPENKVYLRRN